MSGVEQGKIWREIKGLPIAIALQYALRVDEWQCAASLRAPGSPLHERDEH